MVPQATPSARAAPAWPRVLAWAGLACLGIGCWRAFPREARAGEVRPALRACLIDASASATRRTNGWELWARRRLREEAQAAEAAGEELAVVVYGADVASVFGPGPPAELEARLSAAGAPLRLSLQPPGDRGSELARALELVADELLAPDRHGARLALLAEPGYTGPDPAGALARLARARVELAWHPPPAPDLPDLALVALRMPRRPPPGAPLAAAAELALAPGAAGLAAPGGQALPELLVSLDGPAPLDGAGPRAPWSVPAPPPPGARPDASGWLRWTVPIELGTAPAGRTLLRVRALLRGPGPLRAGDPAPENDAASAVALAGERPFAAAVARAADLPAARAWLAGAGRFPGLQWTFVTPAELPALAGELDLVLSLDLAAAELPEEVVEGLVRRGGGWLACGAWRLLADDRQRAGLALLLPLRPRRSDAPGRDVIFLVDGSGSMAGEPFERVKAALRALIDAAPPRDRVYLRFFAATLRPPQELTASGARERQRALQALMRTEVPGGQTAIVYSLAQLIEERAPLGRPALVVLLSDGKDRVSFDVAERAQELHRGLAASGTELAVVAVGDDADLALLGALQPPGRELTLAGDLRGLDELFQREVNRERVREGPALALRPLDPAAVEPALPLAADVLRAQLARPVDTWPTLERYVRAEAQPGATVLWTGVEAEPVLGLQRVGSGLVAVWESAPLPGWAPAWAAAHDLVGPLARAMATQGRRAAGPSLSLAAGRLELRGLDPHWPARVRARFLVPATAGAFDGAGLEAELGELDLFPPARAAGPDPRTRRVARRPAFLDRAPPGAALRVALLDPDGGQLLDQVVLAAPLPAELDPDGPRLTPLAAAGGLDAGELPGPARARSRGGDPRAPGWMLAGLLLLSGAAAAGLFSGRG